MELKIENQKDLEKEVKVGIIKFLTSVGKYNSVDDASIEIYANAKIIHDEITKGLANGTYQYIQKSQAGWTQTTAYISLQKHYGDIMSLMSRKLGLSPEDRDKLKIKSKESLGGLSALRKAK